MKIFLFILYLVLSITFAKAQKFQQSLGLAVEAYTYLDFSERSFLVAGGFQYYPRVNVLSFNNAAISVGAPVTVGAAWVGFINEKYSFIYKLPVAVDFNFGRNSSGIKTSNFGGYFGLGYEWSNVLTKQISFNKTHWFYGPTARAGFRTPVSKTRGLTFSAQCRFGAEWPTKHTAVQMGVAYDF